MHADSVDGEDRWLSPLSAFIVGQFGFLDEHTIIDAGTRLWLRSGVPGTYSERHGVGCGFLCTVALPAADVSSYTELALEGRAASYPSFAMSLACRHGSLPLTSFLFGRKEVLTRAGPAVVHPLF